MREEIILGIFFILSIIILIKNKKQSVIVLTLLASTIWNFIWVYKETLFYFEDIYTFLELIRIFIKNMFLFFIIFEIPIVFLEIIWKIIEKIYTKQNKN
jgi:hypothetical protein